tara:strand:- start:172 stop:450 length:279 start_codon:yes stop_codon:yes gene_type:complete
MSEGSEGVVQTGPGPLFYSEEETAALLGIHHTTVHALALDGVGWFDDAAAVGIKGPHAARAAPHNRVAGVQRGANVKAVQRMLGHASAAVTR